MIWSQATSFLKLFIQRKNEYLSSEIPLETRQNELETFLRNFLVVIKIHLLLPLEYEA